VIITLLRWSGGLLLAAAMLAGLWAHGPGTRVVPFTAGYYVLTADLHLHSLPGDWAALAPWDDILEARRAQLDVIALTSHNHVWAGLLGHWLAHGGDGPIVLVGEEIVGTAGHYHMIAAGIHSTIDWRKSAADAIDEIHAQGGVAIAAHPFASLWASYDARAMQHLDGVEVLHPMVFFSRRLAGEMREFYARGIYAPIGDSDYRGLGPAGICRTYIFARQRTEQGVLDAIRKRHTVVYDQGQYFGEPQFIDLARRESLISVPEADGIRVHSPWAAVARWLGTPGLVLAILVNPIIRPHRRRSASREGPERTATP
jgi:hypothetical protein